MAQAASTRSEWPIRTHRSVDVPRARSRSCTTRVMPLRRDGAATARAIVLLCKGEGVSGAWVWRAGARGITLKNTCAARPLFHIAALN
jgi:hypothetical protein